MAREASRAYLRRSFCWTVPKTLIGILAFGEVSEMLTKSHTMKTAR